MWSDDAIERRMYLRQQAAEAIAGLCNLPGDVIVEPSQTLCGMLRAASLEFYWSFGLTVFFVTRTSPRSGTWTTAATCTPDENP